LSQADQAADFVLAATIKHDLLTIAIRDLLMDGQNENIATDCLATRIVHRIMNLLCLDSSCGSHKG
jgi:hypothetical protein